jgi:hypothetical protein
MYYSTRHEKNVVIEIIKEVNSALKDEDKRKAAYLYHSLVNQFVFLAVKRGDDTGDQTTNVAIVKAVRVLLYSPAWVLLLIIVLDILPLIFDMDIVVGHQRALWQILDTRGRAEVVMRLIFCGFFALVAFRICRAIDTHQSDIVDQLECMRKRILNTPEW